MWADAVKKEKTDILVSLLTTAEVDCRTDDRNTPLHLAVKVMLTCSFLLLCLIVCLCVHCVPVYVHSESLSCAVCAYVYEFLQWYYH